MRFRASSISLTAISLALAGCAAAQHAPASAQTPQAENADHSATKQTVVQTQEEAESAIKAAQPGTEIILANGKWEDFDLLFEAQGTADAPVVLSAQTPGEVILTGQSSLRLAGEHLLVSGLVFRDGYSPRDSVISFRKDSSNLANNSRVTETVIKGYSQPDRAQRDTWVMLYGRNNVFDHNHLAGKTNSGPTLAVRLDSEESRENNHEIRNNYFGPRPIFGSNGGETLRIGTSHYSLTHSGTLVEGNYFDRCSGEVEIISNKAGGNVFRGNTFYQSRGTLTLRHGNGTLVENNFFDGNNKPYTGGVRVINADQTVRNNYFKYLTGTGFSGALVIMNGVPDSPINRYHQVDNASIQGNTFDNVSVIELGEGSDTERTATPVNSSFQGNLIVGADDTVFDVHDDISGIAFTGNVIAKSQPLANGKGFLELSAGLDRSDEGLLAPQNDAGASPPFGVSREKTGVSWFPKASPSAPFDGGQRIAVSPGTDTLSAALENAEEADTLVLAPGNYVESKILTIDKPLTIIGSEREKVQIEFLRPNLFALEGNGALALESLSFSGARAPDGSGNALVTTSPRGGSGNHLVSIKDANFVDFDVNRGFSVLSAGKGSFFDRIDIAGSRFENFSGDVFRLDQETDDYGIYNAEYLTITDSTFEDVGGSVVSIYRGGTDESTFGPHVSVSGSTFKDVGKGSAPLMRLHGVQQTTFTDNDLDSVSAIDLVKTTGDPQVTVSGNTNGDNGPDELISVDDRRPIK
ncbi:polysaccharide lyase 6 family protein [Henriciella sp.]|uniref:polysaccharide lyase 6 family protein n=1 Tax=Henriciella sp. TaxID=1968823 RepID=UPI00262AC2D4|nr:polysaccharide lyase 6 family protein [Henriciella sp.]